MWMKQFEKNDATMSSHTTSSWWNQKMQEEKNIWQDTNAMPNEQIDGTKNRIFIQNHKNGSSHDYSMKELQWNYAPKELIKKDDLWGKQTNPFSLDGR